MRIKVEWATPEPIDEVSRAAGVCYGKADASLRRAQACYSRGHLSVFEHAAASFSVEGISRACMAQLTRHRLCSFCVESQRYNRYDLSGDDWYVIPPSFKDEAYFRKCMREAASHYSVCIAGGMKPEDARYLLPEATKTRLRMTCNARELFHLLDMRQDGAAQWEIRTLANMLEDALKELGGQWWDLMLLREGC